MWVLDKLRDPGLCGRLLERVKKLAADAVSHLGRPAVFMEVCGTHTTAISRAGLRGILAGSLELRSGPGCPVCVTDIQEIDQMLGYARLRGITVATFGDMIRVPGSNTSLEQERARGADVRVVYSPADAVSLAESLPGRQVVFFGVGFETTTPMVALSLAEANSRKLKNYSVFSVHKVVPPVLHALVAEEDLLVDGLILPGHVSAITGRAAFDFLSDKFGIPSVITGFEPFDILGALCQLLEMVLSGRAEVQNGYGRVVREEGNKEAQGIIHKFFYVADASWRGFGSIPGSGLLLKREFSGLDARHRFPIPMLPLRPSKGCRCGDLLKGKITPAQCPLFAGACTPAKPVGPCMVSSEGACSAYYRYERGNGQ